MRYYPRGLALLLVLAASAGTSYGLHQQTPMFFQITTAPSQTGRAQTFAGRTTVQVFESDADLLGNGNATPQIFVFEQSQRVKRRRQGLFQLTFGDQPSRAPAAAKRGRIIAFESAADLLGNNSTGREIFASTGAKHKRGQLPLFQLTNAAGESFAPLISRNGDFLLFASTADLGNDGLNPGQHIYRALLKSRIVGKGNCPSYPCAPYVLSPDVLNPGLDLLSRAVANNPASDSTGQLVAFESTEDVLENGYADGVRQLYLKDFVAGTVEQFTDGTRDSRNPIIRDEGDLVAFESDADLLNTGSTRTQIFLLDRRSQPQQLEQLTFGTDGDSTRPAFNTTGGKKDDVVVSFLSTADFNGNGVAGINQIYIVRLPERQLIQVTTLSESIVSRLAGVYTYVSFWSEADVLGEGNDSLQLFEVNLFKLLKTVAPVPTPATTPTGAPLRR